VPHDNAFHARPPTSWRNRIVGSGEEAPDQLLANPANWRIHPKQQQAALAGSLDTVGWVAQVMVKRRTGFVVDGHARVALAISRDEPTVPVVYVDLAPTQPIRRHELRHLHVCRALESDRADRSSLALVYRQRDRLVDLGQGETRAAFRARRHVGLIRLTSLRWPEPSACSVTMKEFCHG
jgi:hypothetical protein